MREALVALNQLVADGVIGQYAIGGPVGAAYYIEAVQTEDLDAFVFFPAEPSGLLSLEPIYSALQRLGGVPEREFVRFGLWPLQVLPDTTPLVAEAIREARSAEFEGIPTRVLTAEHTCCVALETGRAKDKLRVVMFLEQHAVDRESLQNLAGMWGLGAKLEAVESLIDGSR